MFGILLAAPSYAEWRVQHGAAVVEPHETNSNIVAAAVSCGDPVSLEVYTAEGPVLPLGGWTEADYFYEPNRVEAEIDGIYFPLVALGAGHAVVLAAQADDGGFDGLGADFLSALGRGDEFVLSFDVTPGSHPATDSPFETFARFSLVGSAAAISEALASCPPG